MLGRCRSIWQCVSPKNVTNTAFQFLVVGSQDIWECYSGSKTICLDSVLDIGTCFTSCWVGENMPVPLLGYAGGIWGCGRNSGVLEEKPQSADP